MRKSNFALRLQPSLFDELRGVAAAEDVTLNQFINVAVAEKLAALRTEAYFRDRAEKADIPGALKLLDRLGVGSRARTDDLLPDAKIRRRRVGAKQKSVRR